MGIFDFIKQKTKFKSVFCGLDNSGKSTTISFLQKGTFVDHTPTMGKQKKEIEIEGTRIVIFDMGGQKDFRELWLGELETAKCVVFVIDKADSRRFKEAKGELNKLLPFIKKNKIQLLILANKHDLKDAVSLGKIIEAFDLMELENFEIMEISAKTGYGMADAFTKFYSMLTGKILKKNILAKAISIYNKNKTPIISQDQIDDNKIKTDLKKEYIAAIKQFSEDKGTEYFKTETTGTFIVAKTTNFIGTLLWNEELTVPIKQSEEALKELLKHLEGTCDLKDQKNIELYAAHFITNIM